MPDPETTEERIRRRLKDANAGEPWEDEDARACVAVVMAEEIERLREEMDKRYAKHGHRHATPPRVRKFRGMG